MRTQSTECSWGGRYNRAPTRTAPMLLRQSSRQTCCSRRMLTSHVFTSARFACLPDPLTLLILTGLKLRSFHSIRSPFSFPATMSSGYHSHAFSEKNGLLQQEDSHVSAIRCIVSRNIQGQEEGLGTEVGSVSDCLVYRAPLIALS